MLTPAYPLISEPTFEFEHVNIKTLTHITLVTMGLIAFTLPESGTQIS